ncbi:PIN domain-containing protein [Hylemonella gracilis]|uniref:PilT domain-containing protein n=1 Tax=Hylemonella gracilis ATCC 19624 TaxID=887062 RepID=F3KRE9_9BURK|nr:PIN domain-containing protein [Hylemonella gracilis]EGI77639.1 PilT domain-containing protein [Hylemonella gracilis ATCC 19624]
MIPPARPAQPTLVLDTNVVLDLLLFADPATPALRAALDAGQLRWVTTAVMREELRRVLAYPHIAARMDFHQRPADALLADYDAQVELMGVAPKAPYTCKDADDQKFIDLAYQLGSAGAATLLLSKDKAVLKLKKRLAAHGVIVSTQLGYAANTLVSA